MRIARFTLSGADPAFGIVELAEDQGEHPDSIAVITGDPLVGPVHYTGERHLLDDVRLLAPVIPRSKVIGAGGQYATDPKELQGNFPTIPPLFFKPNTSVIGPDDAIVRPAEVAQLNFEGELAIIIGRIARHVPRDRVDEVIFGYTCANDVTAPEFLHNELGWARAKGWDTFCPIGPWIITHLDAKQAGELALSTTVDGEVRQGSDTSMMLRDIPALVSIISDFTTLLPGDVILTGTPSGVGDMLPGQRVSITVEGIGTLSNPVVADDGEDDAQ